MDIVIYPWALALPLPPSPLLCLLSSRFGCLWISGGIVLTFKVDIMDPMALPMAAANMAEAPARETDRADSIQRAANGVSPVPTSPPPPKAAEMQLLNRVYVLPSNYCGWFGDYTCQ